MGSISTGVCGRSCEALGASGKSLWWQLQLSPSPGIATPTTAPSLCLSPTDFFFLLFFHIYPLSNRCKQTCGKKAKTFYCLGRRVIATFQAELVGPKSLLDHADTAMMNVAASYVWEFMAVWILGGKTHSVHDCSMLCQLTIFIFFC